MIPVKLLRLCASATLPTKETIGSAYYDLYSAEAYTLDIRETRVMSTGWNIEVPPGYFLDIRPRSGLAGKGITINNAPGMVDEDYRGELGIVLINLGLGVHRIEIGDRIAQCALMPVIPTFFEEATATVQLVGSL